MKWLLIPVVVLGILLGCTKKVGTNPSLAFTDKGLIDSCANPSHRYYKNDAAILLSGSAGPHGAFKLRFNAIAFKALTNNGKLPANAVMPEGSMIIKDIYSGGVVSNYAFMYKKSGAWLWGEATADKKILYSVTKDPGICTGCHSQQGNQDLVVSFHFY